MLDPIDIQAFEAARPSLLGLAYRILGLRADAEDAVQDTFVKWANADRTVIESPISWMTKTCTRRCVDLLRSAHRSRVDYVGAWLPEPIHTPIDSTVETELDVASSLTTAFLLLLERLTPKERAAYLLHEIFDVSYTDVAETLEIKESTCRKLVSRAKANIDQANIRHVTPLAKQDQLLSAFQAAITHGATTTLADLLADDIRLSADGGGKVAAIQQVLQGKADVLAFIGKRLVNYWADYRWATIDVNGGRGFVLEQGGRTVASVSFAYDETGKAKDIFIMRNPDKLSSLGTLAIH
ncbi:MAG: sigma-70 family RNA polymerase sigma factor [Pseudomonadota bacterium]